MLKKVRGPEVIKKVEAIAGDVILPDLGIAKEDREKIAAETDIIYHCAATIRFDEPLKKAVLLNVRGTKLMLELAKECKKLIVSILTFVVTGCQSSVMKTLNFLVFSSSSRSFPIF